MGMDGKFEGKGVPLITEGRILGLGPLELVGQIHFRVVLAEVGNSGII
jgi:hypothetical protein